MTSVYPARPCITKNIVSVNNAEANLLEIIKGEHGDTYFQERIFI